MPKVDWKIDSSVVDEFDRDGQFTPYKGPIPPMPAVYQWLIKKVQYIAGTKTKFPQLRVGLELVPRDRSEKPFAGYFIMLFLPIMEKTAFRYVPFLDALGVDGDDFTNRTKTDEEGNIKRIGSWRNTGETEVLAQLRSGVDKDNNSRPEVGWVGPLDADEDSDDDDDEGDEDDD